MAAPTEDEIQTQGNLVFWMLQNSELYIRHDTESFQGHYDDIVESAKGDFASVMIAGADTMRQVASNLIDWRTARQMMDGVLRNYATQQGFPETDSDAILRRLFIYFAEGSERVLTRTFTYGAIASVGGTGDGTIHRLTEEKYGFAIENATPEIKNFRCRADKLSGTQLHQELFEIRGEDVPRDFVSGHVGAQRIGTLACRSADDSLAFVSNPSFNNRAGTDAVPTAITDWAFTTAITNFDIERTDVYRTAVHEGDNPGAVRFKTNDKLTQDLETLCPSLNPDIPYYVQIAYKAENSADGNLTLRVGANSVVVAVTGSTYKVLRLVLDKSLFYRGFNASVLDIEIERSGSSTGEVLVDDLVFAPMTRFDGTWWIGIGGQTAFLVDREFNFTDTVASTGGVEDAINQKWWWRLFDAFLPHDTTVSGNVTWAEAS